MTNAREEIADEPPPFLGSWRRVYSVLLAYLACLIAVLYAFSVVFRT